MTADPLSFLQSVAGFAQANTPGFDPAKIKLATVDPAYVASSYPGTLPKVTFDGETALSGKSYAVMSPYWPQPSDRVVMVPVGATYIIIGPTIQTGSTYIGGDLAVADDVTLASGSVVTWAVDTNLYRSAADTLKTDDSLVVDGSLTVGGVTPGNSQVDVFTASGTWTKPAGAKRVWVRMVGGGGAGGGSGTAVAGASSKGGGGGGGEYVEKWFDASSLNATEAVSVGAGGVGAASAGGGAGGVTTFKAINANGGAGGNWSASNTATWGVPGGDGGTGGTGTADVRSGGGGGAFGFSGPGLSAGGSGGSSVLGGGGRSISSGGTGASTQGSDATGYGGGGGGAQTNGSTTTTAQRGGHGKAGVVIVTTFF